MEIKSCGTQNSTYLVGGLQEHCDVTYVDRRNNKRYQEVPTTNHIISPLGT